MLHGQPRMLCKKTLHIPPQEEIPGCVTGWGRGPRDGTPLPIHLPGMLSFTSVTSGWELTTVLKITNGWNIFQLWHHAELEHIKVDTPCICLCIKQHNRQCTHHVTLWQFCLTIGIMETQRWLNFILLAYKALPWNKNGFPWHLSSYCIFRNAFNNKK
jgi:hypothetical protein